ncbi:MAG TPA: J domain-containing protein [Candidatus Limnocylindrales bacterium]|nr:J domain-containing protein [Candidatus Limnocylindrales bacterium]
MEYRDYYQTLGVGRSATQAEIKKAFRKLAREHHPDVRPNDKGAEQRFKDVNEAYAVLSDPEKRTLYDQVGANWEAFSRAGARAGAGAAAGAGAGGSPFDGFAWSQAPGGGGVRYEFRTTGGDASGFSDFFRMVFGEGGAATAGAQGGRPPGPGGTGTVDFDDLLSGMGMAGAGRRAAGAGRRRAVEATAELTLEEAFHGTSRIVEVDGKRLEVTIPPGVDNGTRIRLSGRGGEGSDLFVVCRVRPHPVFSRRGADLEREVALSLDEALLGGEVAVGTLKGRVLLTIPPGTQAGRTFRLAGQGMPRFRGSGHGDLFVRARVVLPTNLSADARDAARRFLDLVDQPNPRT